MLAYKGFDKDLKCRGFQYEVGKTYKHDGGVKACEEGFHACTHPMDVFNYYPPASSRFALVEQGGKIDQKEDKNASSEIEVVKEFTLQELIHAAIDEVFEKADMKKSEHVKCVSGAASATGWRGAASATGE